MNMRFFNSYATGFHRPGLYIKNKVSIRPLSNGENLNSPTDEQHIHG